MRPAELSVDVAGVSVVSRIWPDASASGRTPVVLLHATGETAQDWDVVAQDLQGTRPVVAINLRGHGPSSWPGIYSIRAMADDVAGVLDVQFPDGLVDLVGHSMGGLVACAVATDRSELVRRLVLEDIGLLTPRPADPPCRPPGILPFDWRVVEQIRPEIDDFDPSWRTRVAAIRVASLVIAGGERSQIPQDRVRELADRLPRGELVTLDTGHLVHAAEPEAFSCALISFLDR